MAPCRRRPRATLLCLCLGVALTSPFAQAASPPTVLVAPAQAAQFVERIEALGTLHAKESVILTAPITETVSAIYFDDGDRVPAGKILVEMTSGEETALLEEAQAQLEEARLQFDRLTKLVTQGTTAQSLVDERRREWQMAQARVKSITASLADRVVRAPFAGVVGMRRISVGALVEPGDAIATLDDDTVMKLEFTVPSVHLPALQPGLNVVAHSSAYPGRDFNGPVTSIDTRVDPVTRSVVVRAALPNPERVLKPGMLMQVNLHRAPRQSIAIPESALVPTGRQQYVFVVDEQNGHRAQRREIRLGLREPGVVEVLEGLKPGENVITDGTLKVRDGQPVTVLDVDPAVDAATPRSTTNAAAP